VDVTQENLVLSPEQVHAVLEQLRKTRHDINNHLAVIMASAELIRQRPELADRLLESLAAKPAAITEALKALSFELEQALVRPDDNNRA
jgi:hypothetical protein